MKKNDEETKKRVCLGLLTHPLFKSAGMPIVMLNTLDFSKNMKFNTLDFSKNMMFNTLDFSKNVMLNTLDFSKNMKFNTLNFSIFNI